jgi:hypothetical protein
MFLLLCSLFFFLMSPPSRMWHRAIACGNCVPHRVLRSPYRARRRNNSAEVAGIEKAHRSGRSQAGATVEGGAKQCHRSAATMATELYEEDYGDSSVKGGMVEPSRATRQGGVERRCAMEMLSSRCGSTHRDVGWPWRCYAPLTHGPHIVGVKWWLTPSCSCLMSLSAPSIK